MCPKIVEPTGRVYQAPDMVAVGEPKSSKGIQEVAREHGKFYTRLIRAFTEDVPEEERIDKMKNLLEALPPHMARVYRKGLDTLNEEIDTNLGIIKQHKGEEAKFLLEHLIRGRDKTDAEMSEILSKADKASYVERGGIPFLEVEPEYYIQLRDRGVIPDSRGFAALRPRDSPNFMVVRKAGTVGGSGEDEGWGSLVAIAESGDEATRKTTEHEIHHLVWHFLGRAGFLRKPDMQDAEGIRAFDLFRSEFSAHIFTEGGPIAPAHIKIRDVEPKKLVYTENKAILETAGRTRDYISLCMEVAAKKGIPPEDFMYAAVRSRNFQEMRENCFILARITGAEDSDLLDVLSKNSKNMQMSSAMKELSGRIKIQ